MSASILLMSAGLVGCSYASKDTQLAPGTNVGGTGDIKFTHKELTDKKHLLTVTAAPGIGETEGSIQQRILVFANEFAARTCPSGFRFENDPNLQQGTAAGVMARSRSYVFVC